MPLTSCYIAEWIQALENEDSSAEESQERSEQSLLAKFSIVVGARLNLVKSLCEEGETVDTVRKRISREISV